MKIKSLILACILFSFITACDTSKTGFMGYNPDEPYIKISSTVLDFSKFQTSNTISITNSGSGEIKWTTTDMPEWLSVSPQEGGIDVGTKDITFTIDTLKLNNNPHAYFNLNILSQDKSFPISSSHILAIFNKVPKVPDYLINAANQIIITKTGQEFFEKYITFNPHASRFHTPDSIMLANPDEYTTSQLSSYYLLHYKLAIPGIDDYSGGIILAVDTLGSLFQEYEISGLPDCINCSEECQFPIDAKKAEIIAFNAGFEEGIKPWQIRFFWHNRYNSYVWQIQNMLHESGAGMSYSASGKVINIDANSGDVLDILGYSLIS